MSSSSWTYRLVPQPGLTGALQRVPAMLGAAAGLAWGMLRGVPFGPRLAPPNPIVAGAQLPPAEVPSEAIAQRQLLRDVLAGGGGPPNVFRSDQIVYAPPAAPFAPHPEQVCRCTAHGAAGVGGGVCGRHCGCYVPTHNCLLCATISSLTVGGGVPFGANPHSAMDRFISVLGFVLLHSGVRGGRFTFDVGLGRPDGCFYYGNTLIIFDYESGDPGQAVGARRPAGHVENASVLETACAAADAGFRVFVIRTSDYAYLCQDGVTWNARCTGGNPESELCMTFRRLFIILNYVLPICLDPPAYWDAFRVQPGGAGARDVPTLRFFLDGFPFQSRFPPFAQMPAGQGFGTVSAAVVAGVALPSVPAGGPAVAAVVGALYVQAPSGPTGFSPYPRNVRDPFLLSLGGAWAPVNLLYLCASLRVFFASLLPVLPLAAPPLAVAAAAAAGLPFPAPTSLPLWMLTIADVGLLNTLWSHTFAPLPALKQVGPFQNSATFSDDLHYTHPDYAALVGRPPGWVFESPPAAASAAAVAAAVAGLGVAPGNAAAAPFGRPCVPPLSPHDPLFARMVIDRAPSLAGPVLAPVPAGAAAWPAGPAAASFL